MQRKARQAHFELNEKIKKSASQHRKAQVNGTEKSGSGTAERGPTRKWWGPLMHR